MIGWHFDRVPRLEALVDRADGQARRLRREMYGAPKGTQIKATLRHRLGRAEARASRLRDVARWARRRLRELAALN